MDLNIEQRLRLIQTETHQQMYYLLKKALFYPKSHSGGPFPFGVLTDVRLRSICVCIHK